MKELHGTAERTVSAPPDACLALFRAIERYPDWYPEVVREVTATDRDPDGFVQRARALLHVGYGPLVRDFNLQLLITAHADAVRLERIPHDRSDHEQFSVTWRVAGSAPSRISVALDANLSVPRLLPVGGVGDAMASGFVAAAARALDG